MIPRYAMLDVWLSRPQPSTRPHSRPDPADPRRRRNGGAVTPKRIQLRRTKGWRKPDNTIVVARPSLWGNPYRVDREYGETYMVSSDGRPIQQVRGHDTAINLAVALYRGLMTGWSPSTLLSYANFDAAYAAHRRWLNRLGAGGHPIDYARTRLAGHHLGCYCPLDQPCHADILLELANPHLEDDHT